MLSEQGALSNRFLFTRCFVVVHVYSFQLKIGISVIGSSGVDAMLIRDNLPELKEKAKTLILRCMQTPSFLKWRHFICKEENEMKFPAYFCPNLVSTLSGLKMHDFPHFGCF